MVIVILAGIYLLILVCLIAMQEDLDNNSFLAFVILSLIIVMITISFIHGYKVGQVDALSNKRVAYELVKQTDGSTKWKRKN